MMEKRNWLWKKKSSEKSPGGTESSGSTTSHSERYSDDQDVFKTSPTHKIQSPEVTSKPVSSAEDSNENMKRLTEKLSAALVNVSAKDDLVKQHSKVAEEAVAGWEKAENEMVALKQQLEAAVLQNSVLEDRVSHLDGALKECVRQLRQAREEQEEKIYEAVVKKTHDWESTKSELESQLQELQSKLEAAKSQSPAHVDPDIFYWVEYLEKENSALKLQLQLQLEELEISTIERDLSTQAAETASKQHLESIKKVAKLEAECRKLKSMACKSSSFSDHRSVVASSIYVESVTDSQSDGGEQLNAAEIDMVSFKNENTNSRIVTASSIPIDLMDDFLEMERLASLPESHSINQCIESEPVANQIIDRESSLRSELEDMIHQTAQLEEKLQKSEAEKLELETALSQSQDCIEASQLQLREAEAKLDELQKELQRAYESKSSTEAQFIEMEVEARKMTAKIESLEAEIKQERESSTKIAVKYRELEEELLQKKHDRELKIKQDDLTAAAGKLAECQKTIASLGNQLKSLATLEDFLIDTASIHVQEVSREESPIPKVGEEWKLHSNGTFSPKRNSNSSSIPGESSAPSSDKNTENSTPSSSSSASSVASSNHLSEKNRNGFAKFFSRSKNGIHLEI